MDPVVHIHGVPETIDLPIEVIVPVEHIIDIVLYGIVQNAIISYKCLENNKRELDLKKKDWRKNVDKKQEKKEDLM